MGMDIEKGDAKKDLLWVLIAFIAIGIIWYVTGGPTNPMSQSGPFLNMPQTQHTETLKEGAEDIFEENTGSPSEPVIGSPYKDKISIDAGSPSRRTNPQEEYIEITASNDNNNPIKITGWKIAGRKTTLGVKIGKGSYLAYSGQVNPQEDIFLKPGERAYIITGQSPVGSSFRINKCSGYFEQFQDFSPSLSQRCPYPDEEILPLTLKDDCLDYIESMPRCEMQISLPLYMDRDCQAYINKNVNYTSCVETHKKDSDFYEPTWMIYLNQPQELWKDRRETIILYDENGDTVDWDSY